MCDDLMRLLRSQRWTVQCIHGDKKQEARNRALDDFRSGRAQILVEEKNDRIILNRDFGSIFS